MHEGESNPSGGFKATATQAANSALSLLRCRLELASIELAEERERLYVRLALMFAAVLLMVFGVLGVGVLIVVYFWDTYRIAAVLVPTLLCIAAGAILLRKSKALGHAGGLPFAATLAEFDKDRAAFAPADSTRGVAP
jgi:uncharacterized membrane protein YqjE